MQVTKADSFCSECTQCSTNYNNCLLLKMVSILFLMFLFLFLIGTASTSDFSIVKLNCSCYFEASQIYIFDEVSEYFQYGCNIKNTQTRHHLKIVVLFSYLYYFLIYRGTGVRFNRIRIQSLLHRVLRKSYRIIETAFQVCRIIIFAYPYTILVKL